MQREVRERFEAEQRSLRDEIRKVLTPEQQQKFEEREGARPLRTAWPAALAA